MTTASNDWISLSDLLDPALFTEDDGSINYKKLYDLFPLLKEYPENTVRVYKIPGTFMPNNNSSVYRSAQSPHHLIDRIAPDIGTLHDLFEKTAELYPDFDCFGTRFSKNGILDPDYTFETYKQVQTRRNHIGSGIRNLVSRSDPFIVSLFSSNRAEWAITSLAAQAHGLITTALYDTLGPTASKYILQITESPIIITSYSKIPNIIDLKKDGLSTLKIIISMDDLDFNRDNGLVSLASQAGLTLIDFKQLETIGKLNPLPLQKPNETLCISFTSGTTGNPKGVVVTQTMGAASLCFVGSIARGLSKLEKGVIQPRYLSFLPLAHIYEFQNLFNAICGNFKIYFPWDPSPFKLLDHLKFIKPHGMAFVPRVYSKMETALRAGLNKSFLGRQFISKVIEYKENKNMKWEDNSVPIFDSIFISSIRSKLGFDNVNFGITGSAPLSNSTYQFLKASLDFKLAEGYGLTETFAGVSAAQFRDDILTSGSVAFTTEIKLKDVSWMNYSSTDSNQSEKLEPEGEVLLRGPQIFKEYYKNEKATREVIDEDGWFHTGDIARIDKLGRICIIDRVKNFFKLAQGEYVSPERIENIYSRSCPSILNQVFIHGDSLQTYLVGILGIDPVGIRDLLKPKYKDLINLKDDELLDKINSKPEIKMYVLKHINDLIRKEGLQGFEKLHNFKVKIEPLKIEDEVLTPTLKIKRHNASKLFRNDLNDLYAEGSLLRSGKL